MTDATPPPLLLRPRPRRPFELTPVSSEPATPDHMTESFSSSHLDPGPNISNSKPNGSLGGTSTPSRTRSILNLTSSTLFGIYSHTGYNTDREEPTTPWGTGAETPAVSRKGSYDLIRTSTPTLPEMDKRRRQSLATRRGSVQNGRRPKAAVGALLGRSVALFAFGVLYGALVSRLHDKPVIAAAKVEGIDRGGWWYLGSWGVAGVVVGQLLPYVDGVWKGDDDDWTELNRRGDQQDEQQDSKRLSGYGVGGVEWEPVVRSIGAFVGIAFAILSLTLALANPAVWYFLDRTSPGFLLATALSLASTAILLLVNPNLIPSPTFGFGKPPPSNGTRSGLAGPALGGMVSHESVGVATWLASVLFVSCVCFGNIGRRLAPGKRRS
ncbi:hypothetical protein LTR50_001012 [Elasticomyces elasticus]|nr:hypothetical protein LTR50_001012 [Elasticomyces elasticus]